jgi:DNA-binding transcriptional regulator YhcF (GntR family)
MIIRLDHASHIPPYEQLRAQLAVMITAGLLEPATRLPTVRDMATVLAVSPGTVARAYRELAVDELVTGRGRHGTVVVDEPPGSEPVIERATRLAARRTRSLSRYVNSVLERQQRSTPRSAPSTT